MPKPISLQSVYTADLDWAKDWRERVLAAVVEASKVGLERLAVIAFKHIVTAQLLLLTGIGFLISDKPLWQMSTIVAQETAARTAEKWKDEIREADAIGTRQRAVRPLGGSFTVFAQAAANIEAVAASLLVHADKRTLAEVARLCAVQGFCSFDSLQGAEFSEVQSFMKKPATLAMLRNVLAAAEEQAGKKALAKRRRLDLGKPVVLAQAAEGSAMVLANNLGSSAVAAFDEQAGSALRAAGLEDLDSMAPRAAIDAFAKAKSKGANIGEVLRLKADELRLEPLRKNLKSIASGLRTWHFFALVLGYEAAHTLPPAQPIHMIAFLTIFRNGGTAANYVNHVVAGCKALGFSTDWHSSEVADAKRNAQLRTARCNLSYRPEMQLLTEELLRWVVALLDNSGKRSRGTQFLVFWCFLLRVQSEGLGLKFGDQTCE